MQTIAIVNEKGGTGKTTTAVNLSAALGELGKRVLLVDLDGQAASSRWLGVEENTSFADALWRGEGLQPLLNVIPNVSLAPGSGKLDSVAHDLRPTQGGQLRKLLGQISGFEYAIIDCPPSLGNRLIGNALLAASHAVVPVETSILALDGLKILLTTLQDIRDGFGHDIILAGVLACRYDGRTKLSRYILAELKRALPGRVFETVIRENVRMRECPGSGQSILMYAPDSHAAEDYRTLAKELLAMPVDGRLPNAASPEDAQADLNQEEQHAIGEIRQQLDILVRKMSAQHGEGKARQRADHPLAEASPAAMKEPPAQQAPMPASLPAAQASDEEASLTAEPAEQVADRQDEASTFQPLSSPCPNLESMVLKLPDEDQQPESAASEEAGQQAPALHDLTAQPLAQDAQEAMQELRSGLPQQPAALATAERQSQEQGQAPTAMLADNARMTVPPADQAQPAPAQSQGQPLEQSRWSWDAPLPQPNESPPAAPPEAGLGGLDLPPAQDSPAAAAASIADLLVARDGQAPPAQPSADESPQATPEQPLPTAADADPAQQEQAPPDSPAEQEPPATQDASDEALDSTDYPALRAMLQKLATQPQSQAQPLEIAEHQPQRKDAKWRRLLRLAGTR